jgi:hypothetical protein
MPESQPPCADGAEKTFLISECARVLFNLSALTPRSSQYTPTDGTLDANTCIDGIIGHLWRCKYSTTGLYAGGTTLRIDAFTGTHF